MDEIGLLVKAIVQEQPYDLLIENRKYLEFAISVLGDDHSTKALAAVLEYADALHECPKNIDSVIHFVMTNAGHQQAFEKSNEFESQLADIADDDEEDTNLSAHLLVDTVYQKAYDARLSDIYNLASKIATGAVKNTHTKETGPKAADEYILKEKELLIVKQPQTIEGDLVENIDHVENHIDSYMEGDSKRVYTGLRSIDQSTLIGSKSLRWIGILGYTHHGKSLLLSTILYNMALHGANIMLCPRESSVEEAWMTFVWLHAKKVCPNAPLASRAEWMREGAMVGTEKYNTIKAVIKDLRNGDSIPGKIVVFGCRSWEEIEEKLLQTNKKYDYDVLAIDYFAHLDMDGGSKKDSDIDKYKKAFRKAQILSIDGINNNKKGIVVITPLQANRKGYEAAADREGDEYGTYDSLNAVEYYTQAAQDMDCVMSVWMEGDKYENATPQKMKVCCMKARVGMKFVTHDLEIDASTGKVCDPDTRINESVNKDRTMGTMSDEDIESSLNTTTTVALDTENWDVN
jgi:hypothetical protein